jgi:hypothetical protein
MGMHARSIPNDKRDGDRHTGISRAPNGFEICRARVVVGSIGAGSSVSAEIIQNTDSVGTTDWRAFLHPHAIWIAYGCRSAIGSTCEADNPRMADRVNLL